MAMTQTQSPWTYTSPMELPLAPRGLNSSGSESSIDSGFDSPLGSGKGSDSPVARALNMLSRLSISSAPSDISGGGVVNASCRGNHQISSPTNLSPELECKTFTTGLLGSDGESDPFDSSSSPEADSGHDFLQQPWHTIPYTPPPPPSHVFPLPTHTTSYGLGMYEPTLLAPGGVERTYYPKSTSCHIGGQGNPFSNSESAMRCCVYSRIHIVSLLERCK
ncbi:hypothetical protein GBAR_LOCUS24719, partial [Geodia barretti]